MEEHKNAQTARDKRRPNRILRVIIGITVLLLVVCLGIWLYQTLAAPKTLFEPSVVRPIQPETRSIIVADATEFPVAATPEPEITDGNMVNILLLGTDLEYKPYAKNGGDFHSDAMIVVAVNFDENRVDLISLPRDTFSRIPGYRGFYKLNAAINCGGGKTEQGFATCCAAASQLLGGISVDYYYAVDMDAVIVIGDAIGGVDFDVDMTFTGTSGVQYLEGKQHLDGLGIYEYMRARTNATKNATDDGRMDRQKQMLLAMFDKMRQNNLLTTVPQIMQAVADSSYTNLTAQQVLALGNYAYRIDPESVGMHTMSGQRSKVMNYVYAFTDQQKRVSLIRDIYGVDVPEIENCSFAVAKWLQRKGLYALRCMHIAEKKYLLYNSKPAAASDGTLSALSDALLLAHTCYDTAEAERSSSANRVLDDAIDAMKAAVSAAAAVFGDDSNTDWDYELTWYKDTNINEVTVDFR